jgi:hypothetical protein
MDPEQRLDDARIDDRPAGGDLADRAAELTAGLHALLDKVGALGRASLEERPAYIGSA